MNIVSLDSFGTGLNAVIIGGSGGIGQAFEEHLLENQAVETVFSCSRRSIGVTSGKRIPMHLDYASEESIQRAAELISEKAGKISLVIVATGFLHDEAAGLGPEKSYRHLSVESLTRNHLVNTIGPSLVAKHFLPLLTRDGKAAFAALSARVGSISDNGLGGWHAYRASKAALNQILKTCSIEVARRSPEALVVGLHPGTVDTGLSKPFQRGVPDGKLFTPKFSTASLLNVINGLGEGDSGYCYAWDGERIPF